MRRFVWPMCMAIDPKEGCHYGRFITYIILKLWDQSYKVTVGPKECCSLTLDLNFRLSILGQYSVGI